MTKEQEMLIASLKYMLPETIYNQVLMILAEEIVQKDTYKIINFCVNNPEDFEPVYLNMWVRNYYDKGYGYSIEDCCRCYNEDTHSHMPIEVFKEYVKLYSLLAHKQEVKYERS